jgi:predicted nucleic acid-binding protein
MKLPDANVLLYALDDTSARHVGARAWLDAALSGSEEVGFAWVVLLAVLRLTTKPAVSRARSGPMRLSTSSTGGSSSPVR